MDSWIKENLCCPVDYSELNECEGKLVCEKGHQYAVVEGVPIFLLDEVEATISSYENTIKVASGDKSTLQEEFYIDTIGVSGEEKEELKKIVVSGKDYEVDPVVSYLVGATNGNMYKNLQGQLNDYPIPRFPQEYFDTSLKGKRMLDIGCSWGRWSTAAARVGVKAVGVDPSLGAVLAAKRMTKKMGLDAQFLVADGRHLPFKDKCFDLVFSYSVLQHFSKSDVRQTLQGIQRTLNKGGRCLIQMPNQRSITAFYHKLKTKNKEPEEFDVRYWTLNELRKTFQDKIGNTKLGIDCFFGLGLQKADLRFMSSIKKAMVLLSEFLKLLNSFLPIFIGVADSIWVASNGEREKV